MNILLLVFLVVLCDGLPIDKAPKKFGILVYESDDTSIKFHWDKVESLDEEDPIIGYKVKVWEVPETKNDVNNGKIGPVEKEEMPPIEEREILVSGNETEVVCSGLKQGIIYEIGVLAYTAKVDGPISNKLRVLLST